MVAIIVVFDLRLRLLPFCVYIYKKYTSSIYRNFLTVTITYIIITDR